MTDRVEVGPVWPIRSSEKQIHARSLDDHKYSTAERTVQQATVRDTDTADLPHRPEGIVRPGIRQYLQYCTASAMFDVC
jgi:hypothetical protein